jgi:hypothetical protein
MKSKFLARLSAWSSAIAFAAASSLSAPTSYTLIDIGTGGMQDLGVLPG